MGSATSNSVRNGAGVVPAYYQVSDLAMRRDWYGLARAYRAQEITQSDADKLSGFLNQATLGDLVALDAQLQAVGVGQAIVLADSVSIADERVESVLTVAASLERQARQRYLAYQMRRLPSLMDAYRKTIDASLRRNLSYRFATNQTVVAREVHRLVEVLHGGVLASERPEILKRIVVHDPQLLVHLINGDYVTPSEARRALQSAGVAVLDRVRLGVNVQGLYSETQLKDLVASLDLAALAQLRHESPDVMSDTVMQRYIRQALIDKCSTLGELPSERIEELGRLVGLLGDDLEFTTVYQRELAHSLDGIGARDIDELRQFVALTEAPRAESLQTMPIVSSYTCADALIAVAILGGRYGWCRDFADKLLLKYGDMYLSRAQQLSLLDERLKGELSTTTHLLSRVYGEVYRLSVRQKVSADQIAMYVPHTRTLVELIRDDLSGASKRDRRVTLVLLAYLIPALHDTTLRTRLFTLLDESVYLRLLNESLAGSALARDFLSSLSKDELLQVVVRWGNAERNGYLLKLIADTSDTRYKRIMKELESRDIAVMGLDAMTAVLDVLSVKRYRGGMTPEKSIIFIHMLVMSYGTEMARQIVGQLGIDRTEELADVSPFYMRLLVDALSAQEADFVSYLLALGNVRKSMTYEQAAETRDEYHRQHVDLATRVLESIHRAIGANRQTVVV